MNNIKAIFDCAILSLNKTGTYQCQDCCKNWTLNQGFCYGCKKVVNFISYSFQHKWPKKYELVSALQKKLFRIYEVAEKMMVSALWKAAFCLAFIWLSQAVLEYVDGWVGVKTVLRIAYSNQKY